MLDSGWRNKAERLRVMILSSAHPLARELGPGLQRVLSAFRRVALSGDDRGLQQEIASIPPDAATPVWEPTEIYGWKIKATLYKSEDQLWWLVYATQGSDRAPGDKELSFLDKILEHLGASPRQHAIIEPLSAPARQAEAVVRMVELAEPGSAAGGPDPTAGQGHRDAGGAGRDACLGWVPVHWPRQRGLLRRGDRRDPDRDTRRRGDRRDPERGPARR